VVLAVLSFRHFGDGYAVLLLSVWIGIGFILQGVSATAVGVGESYLPGRGWYVAGGVVSVIAGLTVLVWPFDSIVFLTVAAGVLLVIVGIISVVHSLQIRKEASAVRQTVDVLIRPAA
jgi:uncharacterized membrane protein HdeD (DUF308 family)